MMGRLVKDVEIRYAQNGTAIAKFTIAVDRRFKREGQPDADFFKCTSFGKQAEFVEKYFKKGSRILLEGELQNNNYEKDGQTVYDNQILVNSVEFCESKNNSGNTTTNNATDNNDFMNIPEGVDEELPFV